MYPVTDRFLTEITKSHKPIAKAWLMRRGALISDDIPIVSGSITDDSTALIRRRAQLDLAPEAAILDLLSQVPPGNGGLWPLGNELKVFVGVEYSDGTQEWVPQGVFRIAKPTLNHSGTITVGMDAYDRSRSVSRARFTKVYTIAQSTNYATAIKNLIKSRLAWLTDADFQFMTTSYLTPQLIFTNDDDPWEKAMEMAQSMGAELFFDGDGICVLRPENDPSYTEPMFYYVEGQQMTILEATRDLDDDEAYNGVIASGENTNNTTPVRAEVWDTDVTSPTYYDPANPTASNYGPVPYFMTSQYITTNAQALDAASANLTRVKGIMEKADFTAIHNPAHQSGDVVGVTINDISLDGIYILDNFNLDIGAWTLAGSCRKRRVT